MFSNQSQPSILGIPHPFNLINEQAPPHLCVSCLAMCVFLFSWILILKQRILVSPLRILLISFKLIFVIHSRVSPLSPLHQHVKRRGVDQESIMTKSTSQI